MMIKKNDGNNNHIKRAQLNCHKYTMMRTINLHNIYKKFSFKNKVFHRVNSIDNSNGKCWCGKTACICW